MRLLWLVALTVLGCSEPAAPAGEPKSVCSVDADCGSGRYCSEASVCRRDCLIDVHCYGPGTNAQCNAQGRCIETVDAAAPPPDDSGLPEGGKPPGEAGADGMTEEEIGGGA